MPSDDLAVRHLCGERMLELIHRLDVSRSLFLSFEALKYIKKIEVLIFFSTSEPHLTPPPGFVQSTWETLSLMLAFSIGGLESPEGTQSVKKFCCSIICKIPSAEDQAKKIMVWGTEIINCITVVIESKAN